MQEVDAGQFDRGALGRDDTLISDRQAARNIDNATMGQIHTTPKHYDPEALRKHLTQAIDADQFPPPSLLAVCRRMDLHQTVATRKCPELARHIMARFKVYPTVRRRVQETFTKLAVESAVNQLLQEGRSLSFHQLARVLPPRIPVRDKRVLQEFKRLRKEAVCSGANPWASPRERPAFTLFPRNQYVWILPRVI